MAIIAAYNEADIIGQVVGDLIRERVDVYVLDNGSTDDTAAVLAPYRGRGLLQIESFPPERGGATGAYEWARILSRKETLAQDLDADWFMHQDADEFREGPWAGVDLAASIARVDAAGYTAIDFEVLNFRPTDDAFDGTSDVREAMPYFERAQEWDKVQIKCWKRTETRVDLASSGGHEAVFPGRRVFPVRFLLRHYPIRGQRHGERKVFHERRPRFLADERKRGWHRQYDEYRRKHVFVRDPATLTRYDADRVRLDLVVRHRGVEELEGRPRTRRRLLEQAQRYTALLERELDRQNHEVIRLSEDLDGRNRELRACHEGIEAQRRDLDAGHLEVTRLQTDLDARTRDLEARRDELKDRARELDARNREVARLQAGLDGCERELRAGREEVDAWRKALVGRDEELTRRQADWDACGRELQAWRDTNAALGRELDARNEDVHELREARERDAVDMERLTKAVDTARFESTRAADEARAARERRDVMAQDLVAARYHIQALYGSMSWRSTAPLRAIYRLIVRRAR